MPNLRYKRLFICLLLSISILNLTMLWHGRDYMARGYGDFTAFYTAAKLLRGGHSGDLYDARLQWSVQREFASAVSIRNGPLPYIRPPFQAVMFLPLAWLNYQQAFVVWMGIKILILLSIPFLLRPNVFGPPWLSPWLSGFLCLAVGPVAMDLLQGQDAILFLLICVLTFRALQRRSHGLAGFWLGLGLFKFHLVLPIILIFTLKKQRRIVLGFLGTAMCLLLASIALFGWRELAQYPVYLWNISHQSGTGVVQSQYMANLRGLLQMFSRSTQWQRLADWLYLPVAILGVVTAWKTWPSQEGANQELFLAGFCMCLPVALLVSFYFSGYDIIVLILPVLLLSSKIIHEPRLPRWLKVVYPISLAFLLLIPVSMTQVLYFHLEHWDAMALLAFSGVLACALHSWRKNESQACASFASS